MLYQRNSWAQSRTGTGAVCVIGLWSYHLFLICSGLTTRVSRHPNLRTSPPQFDLWSFETSTSWCKVCFHVTWCNSFLLQLWPCLFIKILLMKRVLLSGLIHRLYIYMYRLSLLKQSWLRSTSKGHLEASSTVLRRWVRRVARFYGLLVQ